MEDVSHNRSWDHQDFTVSLSDGRVAKIYLATEQVWRVDTVIGQDGALVARGPFYDDFNRIEHAHLHDAIMFASSL